MTGTKFFQSESRWRSILRVALGLFLIFPFLIWLFEISAWSWPGWGDLARPLYLSFTQAFFSTLAAMVIGLGLARAHLGWEHPRFSEAALLLPNLVPPLFFAMGLLSLSSAMGGFPYGPGAVIVAHVLLNSGLVGLSASRILQNRTAGLAEMAWIMGAPSLWFWRRIAWPLVRSDILYLALFIFSIHFTSFSLPLLLSGDRAVTLEVAIFDTIRLDGRWDKAVILALLQCLFLLVWSFVLPKDVWPRRVARGAIPYLPLGRFKLCTIFPAVIVISGWIFGVVHARKHPWDSEWTNMAVVGALTSLILGVLVGFLHLLLFLLMTYVSPHARLERFLNGYLAPSPTITGFGLLLLPVTSELGRIFLCAIALTLISFPLLYRWIVGGELSALNRQIAIARTLGASATSVLFDIVWPQAAGSILRASGLAALWASGDFAISRILLGSDLTLPLVMESLLNNYRYESAELLMVPLAVVGLVVYGLFSGAERYVTR